MDTFRQLLVVGGAAGAAAAIVVAIIQAMTQGRHQRKQIAADLTLESEKAQLLARNAAKSHEVERQHEATLRWRAALADAGEWSIPYVGRSLYWVEVSAAEYIAADVAAAKAPVDGFPVMSSPQEVLRAMFRIATEHPDSNVRAHAQAIYEPMSRFYGPQLEDLRRLWGEVTPTKLEDWKNRLTILLAELHKLGPGSFLR